MDTNKLLDDYTKWLRSQYSIKKIDISDEITTPFTNMIGDNMRIYVTPISNNRIRLSDDGTTLEDLLLYGIDINSTSRKQMIDRIKHHFSVDLLEDVLSVTGTAPEFPMMKQNLISAMIQINDLSNTKKENVENMFFENVYAFLEKEDFGGLPNHSFEGRSGVDYKINYTIPAHKKKPLRMIDFQRKINFNDTVINAYKFRDIMSSADKDSKQTTYSIIYDGTTHNVSSKTEKIAVDANIKLIPWENKDDILLLK
ncbi:hypothetical protein IWT140_00165 [Secundilactobacillus pentosiphilus]|uniref:DUF1828 domain-containing protein n=1 Tax=Secundilactobacillus pentosiphilus TaxID=1714682 RepID=A0A1Z5ILP1_9LACO|nr:DUF1828 domain-containing protein [Secundilactobacillus pentosiphilus]GAX02568.1 hypothetical protein IWT140_00165 [Secundilactobacillus pentosiphilus]